MPDAELPNLDDISKTVFCIPYNPPEEADGAEEQHRLHASAHEERDLENGEDLRFLAYKEAWKICLERMQRVIQELQKSSIRAVVDEVRSSYTNVLPGLPYEELPVVSVINPGLGSTFLEDISTQLENGQLSELSQNVECIVTHLYPGDLPNVSSGMRAIVSSFVEREDTQDRVNRKPSSSLANYDIKFLRAWYRARLKTSGSDNSSSLNLVVVLHEFEQLDPQVMQDIFYICSGSISALRLIFLISMSSSLNYLSANYPRATMSLLRVRSFTTPSGPEVLQEVLLKTFFDTHFEPFVMIGPALIEYLQDYFTRFHSSMDAILTILQIGHLKHFSSDPLTVLVRGTPSTDVLSKPGSFGFLRSLSARLAHALAVQDVELEGDVFHPLSNIPQVIENVNHARQIFYSRLRSLRLGFGIMICIQSFLEKEGYRGLEWSIAANKGVICDAMINLLKGHFTRDVKELVRYTRKLKQDELRSLLDRLHALFLYLPPRVRTEEKKSLDQLGRMKTSLEESNSRANASADISASLSEWVGQYLGEKLNLPEECDLWDIWYTGLAPFPSELLNPSIRASLMAGLLRPHDYVEDINGNVNTEPSQKNIWELPDTSILFKRYLDSGKMINVYDWFESFKDVLDSQRTHLKEPISPQKRVKSKVKSQVPDATEDDDKWDIEVQARFIRALHELDYLGFIKHTNRKADHLLRTIFDVNGAD
ncbi:origin recognition complex subunit 3 N-terminus-domain-containing protein [Gymnopilus junonius]|uniref:Origin recognition complex subunit 3 N-terminus-domain-containing protein n=1 Tax=Gymnopilus junonius TaxID=109634 RepID=A0A9P5NR39_GYMJU|nr:origin recognition complex subunit 3 N-terminus-domain-containing protein [Gymnopilus junonius]